MQDQKPIRLYLKTYLQMLHNSIGTAMFRNFYISVNGTESDAMEDGDESCAFFVSSVLVIFKKLSAIHGTVASTIEDAIAVGWKDASEATMQPGDIVIWGPTAASNGRQHIGFYVGGGQAVSTSSSKRTVASHDIHFGDENRPITRVLHSDWNNAV